MTPANYGITTLYGQHAEHLVMEQAITGHDLGVRQVMRPTAKIGYSAARLGDHQRTRRHVPGVQLQLPEAVESTGSHIA